MSPTDLACAVCGLPIDPSGPGVTTTPAWVEFIEDWRGGTTDFTHPRCYAEEQGVEALIAVVHARDVLNRGVVPRLMMEVDGLRRDR